MRIRDAVVVLTATVSLAGLAACSSSSKSPSTSGGSSTTSSVSPTTSAKTSAAGGGGAVADGYCGKLVAASEKLSSVASSLSDPTNAKQAIDNLVTELKALQDGAPSTVSAALSDMINAFQTSEAALTNPSAANSAALQNLGTKLEADGATITNYVTNDCKTS